jgi:hypothetical protein
MQRTTGKSAPASVENRIGSSHPRRGFTGIWRCLLGMADRFSPACVAFQFRNWNSLRLCWIGTHHSYRDTAGETPRRWQPKCNGN